MTIQPEKTDGEIVEKRFERLPESQAGYAHEACAPCAYYLGVRDGLRRAAAALEELLK